MATQEQRIAGFKAQTRVCEILNQKFTKSGSSYRAIETDKHIDLTEHYDITVLNASDQIVKKIDVKSTSLLTGSLAYTYMNICGDYSVTVSAEKNVNSIELVLVFGPDFDKLYFVDMSEWYDFIAKHIRMGDYKVGRTYVMTSSYAHMLREDPRKGLLDLFQKYHVRKGVKTVAGEEVDSWKADAMVSGKLCHGIELRQDAYNRDWYFENGSRYVLVTEAQAESLCKSKGHIVKV